MKASKLFLNTTRNISRDPNEFLYSAGFILPAFESTKMAFFPPIGTLFFDKLKMQIANALKKRDIHHFVFPPLQPFNLWQKSGRAEEFGNKVVYASGKTMGEKRFIYSPTNEEVVADFARKLSLSYKNLPMEWYQFDVKLRDDGSSRRGVIRTNAFPVLEGNSLNSNRESLDESYEKFGDAFAEILKILELDYYPVSKRKGYTTFIAASKSGDTKLSSCQCRTKIYRPEETSCPDCNQEYTLSCGTELGCLMAEGQRYSRKMHANYTTNEGAKEPIFMGTYALGLTRLLYTLVEQKMGMSGMVWPESVRPIDVAIIPLKDTSEEIQKCEVIERELSGRGLEIMIDDTKEKVSGKLRRADLLGIPNKIIPLEDCATAVLQYTGETQINGKEHTPYAELARRLI